MILKEWEREIIWLEKRLHKRGKLFSWNVHQEWNDRNYTNVLKIYSTAFSKDVLLYYVLRQINTPNNN